MGADPPPVTQWSLELRDPAAVRPPSRPPAADLEVVRETRPGAAEWWYRTIGADWQWTDRLGWSPEEWAAWEQRTETWVLRAGGQDAGCCELDLGAADEGSVELSSFGLLAAHRGRGLGGHLLAHGLRRALALAPRAWVHTCSLDGPHALANYRARGLVLFRTETLPARSGD